VFEYNQICEHPFVILADALLLLIELADKEDERFQTAAACGTHASCSRRTCRYAMLRA
jgi:hypothetical protein